ncbi:ATP-binding cassette domain-containing protein [Salinirussus salinus]|uniref:ATP-binding cassette domain-containing protein n=1 Tax=Salinirussus salinus TaxID=1198300 RepID=UPI00135A0914
MIRAEGVELALGGTEVLEGVTLRVGDGEFVGLVGPNGAGKTTLLRCINGVLEPDGGAVTLDGRPVAETASEAVSRLVATVPQDGSVAFDFTVERVVEMGRTPHRSRLDWSDGSDAVERAMERTGVARFRDRDIGSLSGGERRRVLLARALAQETPALLLDEPTASLDIDHQVRMLGLVADLVSEGRTALAAIHDLDLAARFCDRVCLLSGGEIRAAGPPAEVLTADALEAVFGTAAAVEVDPATGAPTVTALRDRPERGLRVHVAGGGRAGARAVSALWRAGCTVSLGPVPEGDAAAEAARGLDCPVVTVPAFGDPTAPAVTEDLDRLLGEADVCVDTGGPGSEVARERVQAGALPRGAGHTVTVGEGEDPVAAVLEEEAGGEGTPAPETGGNAGTKYPNSKT